MALLVVAPDSSACLPQKGFVVSAKWLCQDGFQDSMQVPKDATLGLILDGEPVLWLRLIPPGQELKQH